MGDGAVEGKQESQQGDRQGQDIITAKIPWRYPDRAEQQGKSEEQGDIHHIAALCVAEADFRVAGQGCHSGNRQFRARSRNCGQASRHEQLGYAQPGRGTLHALEKQLAADACQYDGTESGQKIMGGHDHE
ncbi:MAG: hypothetical protein QMD17_01755 [Rhodocyclaceae bacterium]|nr:hypothetical protein [Rhodocyclaceae bacterium]